jgi:hypothetical protein
MTTGFPNAPIPHAARRQHVKHGGVLRPPRTPWHSISAIFSPCVHCASFSQGECFRGSRHNGFLASKRRFTPSGSVNSISTALVSRSTSSLVMRLDSTDLTTAGFAVCNSSAADPSPHPCCPPRSVSRRTRRACNQAVDLSPRSGGRPVQRIGNFNCRRQTIFTAIHRD